MSPVRVHRPTFDPERCKVCELCRLMCPDLAITKNDKDNRIHIDLNYCKGCGICAGFCPKGSIRMELETKSEHA